MNTIASFIDAMIASQRLLASEVRLLAMHALSKTRIQLITQAEQVLTETEVQAIQQLIERRLQGEPVAYLIGEREFFGLPLRVTPDVLIPRPETELLVELALQLTPPQSNLLELGTGSGAISIAIANQRADIQISACDVSPSALKVAEFNATKHRCSIHFLLSDWYANLPNLRWHTIVSNPPYIAKDDPHLVQGDLRFEPINALTDHADGLSAHRNIIQGATTRLVKGGWLLLEHGYDQAAAIRHLLFEHPFVEVQSWRDLAGIERVTGGLFTREST